MAVEVVQWLRLWASTAGGMGLIPGLGSSAYYTVQSKKKKKRETWSYCRGPARRPYTASPTALPTTKHIIHCNPQNGVRFLQLWGSFITGQSPHPGHSFNILTYSAHPLQVNWLLIHLFKLESPALSCFSVNHEFGIIRKAKLLFSQALRKSH